MAQYASLGAYQPKLVYLSVISMHAGMVDAQ